MKSDLWLDMRKTALNNLEENGLQLDLTFKKDLWLDLACGHLPCGKLTRDLTYLGETSL